MSCIEVLQQELAAEKESIISHPLYKEINKLTDIQRFAETHVFAVWDFMSLLKSLQMQLTCVSLPWHPVGDGNTRYLINEIVAGEESDVDAEGVRKSHFELYLEAMDQMEADASSIKELLHHTANGKTVQEAMDQLSLPEEIKSFVNFTFNVIEQQPVYVQAAVFTFGREDLIPGMFHKLIKDLSLQLQGKLDIFNYYLERHIEVDGDHHSLLAMEMVSALCGNDKQKWIEATDAAKESLRMRKTLWDGALRLIQQGDEIKNNTFFNK
ncbi:DUF3050 domain-containing protein [Danxiaibacter flavus]|uniref:DUF3050 domain-containing protein n=1 Tax=Danxiaibacter flavus TaxID=3049108 RepID=A0ABV3ZGN0_9BACT|nr:DUF3050 domain-containing protein [Chitinophagaceae bacterium DXS]